LFFRTLPPAEFERCRTARYATLWPSWRALHATAFVPWPRRYARIDTSDYDVFLAQTPWPGTVDPRTRLVVRYHDSTPVFLPHTVKQPRLHQFCHMSALRANAETAAFACVSAYAQTKLLQIFPELGPRSFVVHDSIAPDYFPPSPARGAAADIVTSRIDASSEPQLGSSGQRRAFYDTHVAPKDFRFILMVSTLEPRKNHLGLLAAWEALRSKSASPLALVLVGSPGWGNKNLLRAMQKWQQQGELFHLSAVPAVEMRTLYAAADAVVCPSVDEGFDLPAVEALCCGGAVAASDIPVHREILGDAAAFFDPYSTERMCEALVGVLAEETQQELRRKAVVRAASFDKSHTLRQWERVFDYCRANETRHAGE
jgi:glycosyltransferase involved in cell wall biosynthesis